LLLKEATKKEGKERKEMVRYKNNTSEGSI